MAFSLIASIETNASWELVRDFESGGTTGITFTSIAPLGSDGDPSLTVIDDPINSGNNVLKLDSGDFGDFGINGIGVNNAYFTIPIPDITTKGTVYSRFAKSGDKILEVWGTTSVDEPQSYADFSTAQRINTTAVFQYRDGLVGYPEVIGSVSVPLTWYESWTVLDVTAKTYDLWIRGGVYSNITNFVTGAGFRSTADGPQDRFYARASTGSPPGELNSDFTIYDDIWVDTSGENLLTPSLVSVPEPSAWALVIGALSFSLVCGRRRR